MLEVRRLRMLREVALHGTIRAAAESLSFTPSAVSQQLSALERDLGVELLERRGRSVHLTPAARALVARTEQILVELAAAEAEARSIANHSEQPLRVASFPSAAATILADAVRENGLEVHILEADPRLGLARLRSGEVELAILWEYDFVPLDPGAGVELQALLDDPIQVVLPATHPRAAEPALELGDLAEEAWIDSTTLSSCHPFLRRACNAAGFEPRVAAETNDHRTLHHLVASGQGLALIPVLSQLDLPASLVARSIRTSPPKRRIHAAFRSSSPDPRVGRLLERLNAAAKSRPAALDLVRAGK
ncbi:MAG TPA: LysR family transcriptional regulator [Gaiellaceae bacterium]